MGIRGRFVWSEKRHLSVDCGAIDDRIINVKRSVFLQVLENTGVRVKAQLEDGGELGFRSLSHTRGGEARQKAESGEEPGGGPKLRGN